MSDNDGRFSVVDGSDGQPIIRMREDPESRIAWLNHQLRTAWAEIDRLKEICGE